ncbi:MAG TPA: hypothetical protein VN151_03805 [Terracidiphilus sp.]|nr:hypothetical protein [Terracidiphilus sp.]
MDIARREVLKAAAALLVDFWAESRGFGQRSPVGIGRKVVLVTCGGIRREDTFSDEGAVNIPHLRSDLLPGALFFPAIWNRGVTSHYNTISSILSSEWQHLDDWGKSRPAAPTLFEHLRKQARLRSDQTWFISSNKAMTSQIGASSVREFGPEYGANVVFPKQLLINAVVRAAAAGNAVSSTERAKVQPELEVMLNSDNYDGLGWSISGESSSLDAPTFGVLQQAIENLIRTNAPVTGDEFTFLVSAEVMRRFAPDLLVITFSDMEVAHFGSYSLHLAGIRTVDRLAFELWNLIQELPAYKDKTTFFVLPEFGRDVDGSPTNGFFNHRYSSPSTRLTWMLCMGDAVRKPGVVEQPVQQTDIAATIAQLFGLNRTGISGSPLAGVWL